MKDQFSHMTKRIPKDLPAGENGARTTTAPDKRMARRPQRSTRYHLKVALAYESETVQYPLTGVKCS